MKRDLDLVRTLLRVIEGAELRGVYPTHGLDVLDPRVQYHLRLLVEARLARCVGVAADGGICLRLTWQGHELLELSRQDAVWQRARQLVEARTGGLSAEAVQAVLRDGLLQSLQDAQRLQPAPRPRLAELQPPPVIESLHRSANGNGNGNGHHPPAAKPAAAPAETATLEPPRKTVELACLAARHPWHGKHADSLPLHLL